MAKNTLYTPKEALSVDIDGVPRMLYPGKDRVRYGHPLLHGREHLFEEVDDTATYDVEQATAAPGEQRGARKGG